MKYNLEDRIESLKIGDLVTFDNGNVSWGEAIWTIYSVTDKAIRIDNEWIPKSQICLVSIVERRKEFYNEDGDYDDVIVEIPELVISKWFDEKNDNQRGIHSSAY